MKKRFSWLALGSVLLSASNCTTHKGFVNYQELGVFSSDNVGNLKFKDVGPISTSASSFVWTSCDTVATNAVRELLDIAKTRGGNTVYEITFESGDSRVSVPTCYRRWGWFVVYIAPGLGPWMTASAVEGFAASLEKAGAVDGIQLTPFSDTQKLAADYIQRLGTTNIK